MKKIELKQIIREELKKILKEGHDMWIGELNNELGKPPKNAQEAIKFAQKMEKDDNWSARGTKWVGSTSERNLEQMASRNENIVFVGKVGNEFWFAIAYRT